jgi:hypothetical protein
MARMLSTLPGSANWAWKNLAAVDPSNLSTTQRTNTLNKKCNTYETRGGINITEIGYVVSGDYIDITVGLDWLTSQIQTNLFQALVNLPKIPFTNGGLVTVKGYIMQALTLAVTRGILSSDTPPTVTMPALADISSNDKANRSLTGVTFTGVLAGAINKITINGFISV